jgi:hypothetical protein
MRNGRTDANQTEIVEALRGAMCTVWITSDAGDGFTDLVVWTPYLRRLKLLECKDGNKPPSKQKLTPPQVIFHRLFEGKDCHVVNSVKQALEVIGI